MGTNNMKNNSNSIRGIFGGQGGDDNGMMRIADSRSNYEGMLPNLNVSKRECKLFNIHVVRA
jgi:hypothetical protein